MTAQKQQSSRWCQVYQKIAELENLLDWREGEWFLQQVFKSNLILSDYHRLTAW